MPKKSAKLAKLNRATSRGDMPLGSDPGVSSDEVDARAETRGLALIRPSASAPSHTPPQAQLIVANPAAVALPSDRITRIILRSLLNGREYVTQPDIHRAEFRHPFDAASGSADRNVVYDPATGQIVITFESQGQLPWEHVLEQLELLGDETVDTFCAFLALALDQNGPEHLADPVKISTDDILAICRRRPSRGGYQIEQRYSVIRHLDVLAQATVEVLVKLPRRGWVARYKGPIVEKLGDVWGVYRLDTGETLWEQRMFKLGEWASQAPHLPLETAMMLRQVFAYHPQRERVVKRLGRCLTWTFAELRADIEAQSANGVDLSSREVTLVDLPLSPSVSASANRDAWVEMTMGELLDAAGIVPDRNNPSRTSMMIEEALAKLQRDGIIGSYSRVIPESEEAQQIATLVDQRAYHWWDHYLSFRWRFTRPNSPIS